MSGRRLSRVYRIVVRRWVRVVLSLLLFGCAFLSGHHRADAQATDITVTVEEVETATVPTVRVHVSVRDQNGVPIQDLTAESFEVVEDGAAVFVPTTVEAEAKPDAQVSLAIVIDLYRTLKGEPVESAQQATQDLLTDLLNEPNDPDRAAFVGVRQGVTTDPSEIDEAYEVPFTNDRNKLLNVINFLHERIQSTGPGTPLYDAVIKAIRMAEASEPIAHRAVIVMTDGEDRGSISTDSDTIQRASSARTPVFAVGLSNSGLDEGYLRRLAENTGGTYQTAETPDDFSSLFSNVLTTLRTQYVLTYESGLPRDGQPHSVMVRVRTPTQLEGFDEYRVTMPGGIAAEEEAEEAVPTAEGPASDEGGETEPAPGEEGEPTSAMDWIQDNLLIVGLAAGAALLLLLVVVIVAVIIIRRRGSGVEAGASDWEVPSYPPPDGLGFDAEPWEGVAGTDDMAFESGGTAPGPSPTVMDGEQGFGVGPVPQYEEPASAPPPFPQPAFQASSADKTRILDSRPKLSTVGLLIDRDSPDQRLDVAKPVVSIGRSQESDVVVDHNTVSRQHAVIKLEAGQFRLYDVGSTNGTFIGDTRIHEPVVLEDGTVVTFGEKAFVFKVISLGA